jgi:hypothetical protein
VLRVHMYVACFHCVLQIACRKSSSGPMQLLKAGPQLVLERCATDAAAAIGAGCSGCMASQSCYWCFASALCVLLVQFALLPCISHATMCKQCMPLPSTDVQSRIWQCIACTRQAHNPVLLHIAPLGCYCVMLHLLLLLPRLGLPGFLQPAVGPCPPRLLAWHCNQQQLAIGHAGSGAVLLYDLSTAAAGGDAESGILSQAQQVLTHQLQQQVRAPAAEPVPSDLHACV